MHPNDQRSIEEVYGCMRMTSGDLYHLDTTLNEIVLLFCMLLCPSPAVLYASLLQFEVCCFLSLVLPFFSSLFYENFGRIRSAFFFFIFFVSSS